MKGSGPGLKPPGFEAHVGHFRVAQLGGKLGTSAPHFPHL